MSRMGHPLPAWYSLCEMLSVQRTWERHYLRWGDVKSDELVLSARHASLNKICFCYLLDWTVWHFADFFSCHIKLVFRSEISDVEYETVCNETLDSLTERFDEIGDTDYAPQEYDINFAVSNHMRVKINMDSIRCRGF